MVSMMAVAKKDPGFPYPPSRFKFKSSSSPYPTAKVMSAIEVRQMLVPIQIGVAATQEAKQHGSVLPAIVAESSAGGAHRVLLSPKRRLRNSQSQIMGS